MLLCLSSGGLGQVGEDLSGDVSLEASDDLAFAEAFGGVSFDVGAGWFVSAAAAASTSPVSAAAGSIDRYVSSTSVDGLTGLAGVHAEYRSAIQIFPFPLPAGVSFPPESSYRDAEPVSAYERGDGAEAGRLLSTLESVYSSSVRIAVWEDSAGTFAPALKQARSSDYQGLLQLTR